MSRDISVGIDIGTYQVKIVVAEKSRANRELPRVIGTGFAESKGLRHGYILSQEEAAESVREAIGQAERASGARIRRAYLSIGGIGLGSVTTTGSIVISRADSEITELDLKKVLDVAEGEIPAALSNNRKIIHSIPLQYRIDGKPVLGRPVGLKGTKFEVKAHFITCLESHVHDLLDVVGEAGVEAEDVVAAPIAASLVTLTKAQKIAGVVLTNVGSETVSIVVYENGLPVSLEVFPRGGADITNDIALGLRIPLEEAEDVKRGAITGGDYPKKKLDEIVLARLSDIFDLIDIHLKKIGRSGLLPAGIVLTGGTASIEAIGEVAKSSLKLPSRIAALSLPESGKAPIKDSSWSVAYGLSILGLKNETGAAPGKEFMQKAKRGLSGWLKQFLP